MQRLQTWERDEILARADNATEADIDELEKLAAERFTIDPDFPLITEFGFEEDRRDAIEQRMAELSRKMSGGQ